MSVGWTCPSVRKQDPIARMNGEPGGPCPGHRGPHRIMHTPRQPVAGGSVKELSTEELQALADRLQKEEVS